MSNHQNFWLRAATGIDALNERIGKAISWLTVALVALVAMDVVIRYLFSDSRVWITELQWHLFSLIFLLGAGYAFRHDRHVRVDLFYSKFNEKDKALVDFTGNLLFLIPWCLVVGWFAVSFAVDSFQINETSADAGGLPARYLVKSAIAAGILLLLLQSIAQVFRAGVVLFKVRLKG